MSHFKSILLSLILVFTYSQVHAEVYIELGKPIAVTNKNECIKAIEKGILLSRHTITFGSAHNYLSYLYKGFIYDVTFHNPSPGDYSDPYLACYGKRSLGN